MSFRPPSPGVLVDNKYRLAERIGGGGMGDVFRAENVLAGRAVAIKFLHPELSQNTELSQRFFQEAQAVNRIRHPNVVDVLDAGVGEMGPYIVMEYLDGESVGAVLLRVGRFEVEAAVGTAIPVLEALDAAHRAGIIHRDLKPENVFIAADASRGVAVVRLLDFGIAKILDATGPSPRTRTGVVFGTPDYLSPEQATGEAPLDGRSDLFAVGVLIYELVTGTRPFRAPTAVATAFRVVHAEAPSIAAAEVHVDAKLEAVVHRLLQKEPAKRYPSALDVIRDLDRVVPDPARRVAALGRLINVARRGLPAVVGGGQDVERFSSPSREPAGYKRSPEIGQYITQIAPRAFPNLPNSRSPESPSRVPDPPHVPIKGIAPIVSDAPKSPRSLLVDLPKTARSASEPFPFTSRVPESEIISPGSSLGLGGLPGRAGPHSPAVMRSFPQRFLGRYHVRGPVLSSVDKVVAELFGTEARNDIMTQLPNNYAAEFRDEALNALVAYALEALDAYMEHATYLVVRDTTRWREIGRLAVDGDLYNVVRTLLRPANDLASVLRRGITIWSRLFSFGNWRVVAPPNGKVELHVAEFDPVGQPLRYWVVGMIEQITRRAMRVDVRISITHGEQSFSPELKVSCETG